MRPPNLGSAVAILCLLAGGCRTMRSLGLDPPGVPIDTKTSRTHYRLELMDELPIVAEGVTPAQARVNLEAIDPDLSAMFQHALLKYEDRGLTRIAWVRGGSLLPEHPSLGLSFSATGKAGDQYTRVEWYGNAHWELGRLVVDVLTTQSGTSPHAFE